MRICSPRLAVPPLFLWHNSGSAAALEPGIREDPWVSMLQWLLHMMCFPESFPDIANNLQLPFRLHGGSQFSAGRKESPGNPQLWDSSLSFGDQWPRDKSLMTEQGRLDRGIRVADRVPTAPEFLLSAIHVPAQWPEQGHWRSLSLTKVVSPPKSLARFHICSYISTLCSDFLSF